MNMIIEFKNKLKIILVVVILFIGVVGKAQFRVMVTPSLEIPMLQGFKNRYNTTFGIKAGGFYEWRKLSLGLSVGYHSLSPSDETLNRRGLKQFRLDSDNSSPQNRYCDTCAYTEEFGNLTMIPILLEWNQYFLKTEKVKLSFGFNVGFRIYSYSHVIRLADPIEKDPYSYSSSPPEMIEGVITTDKKDVRLNVSPKLAFEYMINDLFSIYFEPSINMQTGAVGNFFIFDNDDDFFEFDNVYPGSYTIDQMFTASLGVGIIYNFGYPAKITQRKEVEKKHIESEKIEWIEN